MNRTVSAGMTRSSCSGLGPLTRTAVPDEAAGMSQSESVRAPANASVAVSRPAGTVRLYDCSRARGVSVPRYVAVSAGGGGGGVGARPVSVPGASTRPY